MENLRQPIDLNNLDKSDWLTYQFQEIAQKISQTVKPEEAKVDVYVGLEHLDGEDIHIRRKGSPLDVKGGKLRCYPGDIIFGKRRAYQRKAAIVDFDGICSAHAFVFRAIPEVIDPRLFPFFLHSDQFMHRMVDISVGGLSPTINWGDLKHQEFLLPPKDQQARLAELLWAMDAVVEGERGVLGRSKTLLEAFNKEFWQNEWPETIPLEKVGTWQSGGTPSRKNPAYWGGKIPWVSPKDMKKDHLMEAQEMITEEGVQAGSRLVPTETVFIVVRGMILAHTFPVAIAGQPMAFNQDMKALIVNKDFHPKLVLYFLKKMASLVLTLTSQSSHGTKTVPTNELLSLRIPVISSSDQLAFLERVEQQESNISLLESSLTASRALQKSLINQIF